MDNHRTTNLCHTVRSSGSWQSLGGFTVQSSECHGLSACHWHHCHCHNTAAMPIEQITKPTLNSFYPSRGIQATAKKGCDDNTITATITRCAELIQLGVFFHEASTCGHQPKEMLTHRALASGPEPTEWAPGPKCRGFENCGKKILLM